MYTGYLFLLAFAILVTNSVCDDFLTVNSDGKKISVSIDEICTNTGFVKNNAKIITKDDPKVPAPTNKMSTADIILTVLGVTAGVLILAFAGTYFYNKQKVN